METPEFLVWALEYSCPVRGPMDGSDPERTERQLRAARAASDARRERRVFEGLCVDPPDGFRIDDALSIYGGLAALERECGDCPANALTELAPETLAGCFGLVPLPHDPRPFHEAVERGIETAYSGIDWDGLCPVTKPRWYGLWLDSPLWAELLLVRFLVLHSAPIVDAGCRAAVAELLVALNVAFNANCRLHVRLYPRGRVEGTWWRLEPHCPRCKAPWGEARSRECSVCGYRGHSAPDKKRRARGRRPFFPLTRLLGEQAATEFLVRYEAFQTQRQSTDREQSPLREEQPDNPPAD